MIYIFQPVYFFKTNTKNGNKTQQNDLEISFRITTKDNNLETRENRLCIIKMHNIT